MSAISVETETRREHARRLNGEFGNQDHAESGIVDIPDDEETETPGNVFWGVSLGGYQRMLERVAKINTRAAKRGFTGSFELTAEFRTISETDETGFTREYEVADVTLEGTAPKYDGWTFLATVEPVALEDGTTEFILRSSPWKDETAVDRSALQEGWCDHCKTTRHNRRKIYLVRNEDGETKQVGSTCIKDFLGWSAGYPYMPDAEEIEDDLRSCYSADEPRDFNTTYSVAVALAAAKAYGWQPASSDRPTKGVVMDALADNRKAGEAARAALAPFMEQATAEAPMVIETVLANLDTSTDFGQNLSIALRTGSTNYSRMGLVAATVSAYQRITLQQAEKAIPVVPSEWVGQLKDKIAPTVTVVRAMMQDGYAYNTTQMMLILKTSDGNVLKAYSTAGWTYQAEPGDTFVMDAVVKGHETYHDTKQTVVTRIKRREPEPAAPETVVEPV